MKEGNMTESDFLEKYGDVEFSFFGIDNFKVIYIHIANSYKILIMGRITNGSMMESTETPNSLRNEVSGFCFGIKNLSKENKKQ